MPKKIETSISGLLDKSMFNSISSNNMKDLSLEKLHNAHDGARNLMKTPSEPTKLLGQRNISVDTEGMDKVAYYHEQAPSDDFRTSKLKLYTNLNNSFDKSQGQNSSHKLTSLSKSKEYAKLAS